jgi:hypothetical protein
MDNDNITAELLGKACKNMARQAKINAGLAVLLEGAKGPSATQHVLDALIFTLVSNGIEKGRITQEHIDETCEFLGRPVEKL